MDSLLNWPAGNWDHFVKLIYFIYLFIYFLDTLKVVLLSQGRPFHLTRTHDRYKWTLIFQKQRNNLEMQFLLKTNDRHF